MRKICIVTGSRAEYGLLYWLMKSIDEDPDIELQLITTGMHLSPEFGLTWKQIEDDGFTINHKVEMLLSSDTAIGIAKSMGVATLGFADAFDQLKPNIVVLLGDRFEIFSAASVAMVCKIPIAHLHGGEVTLGAYDEAFRHSISKMSHFHFTAAEAYRNRVIQLGENPDRVYNVGGLGIDNIKKMKLLTKADFEHSIGIKLNKKNLLITFHPVTLEDESSSLQMKALLEAIDQLADTHFIFTYPNADNNGRDISKLIEQYVSSNPTKSVVFRSLGQLRYLSALQLVDGVVGNSSSGLIEAPSFKIGTINIGDRQQGRIKASSVIDCPAEKDAIAKALDKLFSSSFKKVLEKVQNPYGEGGASEKIKKILKDASLKSIHKKQFYDIS